jgi:hypothetical protein
MENTMLTTKNATEKQYFAVSYTIPTPSGATMSERHRDLLAIRRSVGSARQTLAEYGLQKHEVILSERDNHLIVISPERDFLERLPNPLHGQFARSDYAAPYDIAGRR